MEITLKANKGEFEITKYAVDYPFSVQKYVRGSNKILRTTSALKCKNIQDSFRLYISRKIDFTAYTLDKSKNKVIGGVLDTSISTDHALLKFNADAYHTINANAKHYMLFPKVLFLYVNENNPSSYLNEKKRYLPIWLINSVKNIKEIANFQLEYEKPNLKLKNEEITIYLDLEYE